MDKDLGLLPPALAEQVAKLLTASLIDSRDFRGRQALRVPQPRRVDPEFTRQPDRLGSCDQTMLPRSSYRVKRSRVSPAFDRTDTQAKRPGNCLRFQVII